MSKSIKDKNNDEDNDCKVSVQEKKQADEKKKAKEENQSNYHSDMDNPPKKKRNRKISMIFPLVPCCSCVSIPSSS